MRVLTAADASFYAEDDSIAKEGKKKLPISILMALDCKINKIFNLFIYIFFFFLKQLLKETIF